MSKFNFEITNVETAFQVWKRSPNRNIFNNPKFLVNFENIEFLLVKKGKGNELICCWPICRKKNSMIIPNFFYYFGPYWSENINSIPFHSLLSTTKNVYEIFIDYFTKNFDNANFQFHYTLNDVRSFDWWNFENKDKKNFIIKPKYTALIENPGRKNISSIFRYVRRYEIKNFKTYSSKIEKCTPKLKDILDLYLNNYSIDLDSNKLREIEKDYSKIFELAESGFGEIKTYREKSSKKIIYSSICLNDDFSKHLILTCAEKGWRKNGIMAWALNEVFLETKNKYQIFDFNGANSPKRGDDKHSYGAKEKLFFEIQY